jgi:hypothetical protein
MNCEQNWKNLETIRIFKLLLVAMSIVYGLGFVLFLIVATPDYLNNLPGRAIGDLVTNLSFYVQNLLIALVYFLILYNLYGLLVMIARGNPFDPSNPKRIRRVAYGAFALTALNLGASVILAFSSPKQGWTSFYAEILGQGFRTILFGVGILVIGKVFEAGARLKQDQDLTV